MLQKTNVMTQRMERFSQEARRVLNASEREATDMDHPAIMPLHLLLGMLEVTNCKAYRVLRELSLEHRDVLPMVQELSPTMVHAVGAARRAIELSPETRRVLEYGIDEARKVGADCIGSEHLLLGLMKKPDYAIINVLQRASLDPDTIRRTARRMMIDDEEAPETAEKSANGSAPVAAAPDPRMKIIEMVEAGKITAAEAGDLLRAMQATSIPAVAFTNRITGDVEQLRTRQVRLVIADKVTRQPKADVRVPVERLQAEMFVLIQLLYNGYTGKVGEFPSPTDQITISIE